MCNIVEEANVGTEDENDNENDNTSHENDNDAASTDQMTTTGNGPSKGPQVDLGQSNGSPRTPLVYTKDGCGGQDEHPCLKVDPEGVDESGGYLEGGGGIVGDDDDIRVDPVIVYETDEEEFLDLVDHSPVVVTRKPDLISVKGPVKQKIPRNGIQWRQGGGILSMILPISSYGGPGWGLRGGDRPRRRTGRTRTTLT